MNVHSERLRRYLLAPTQGVLGLVEELLAIARQEEVRLDATGDRFQIHLSCDGQVETIDTPLRRSVVRASLARVAVLCNEHRPNAVSPYGGEGELPATAPAGPGIRVSFVNTLDEQRLELVPTRTAAELVAQVTATP